MKYAWALMVVLLMSGCASMTREQCQSVDPQAQGYADGQKRIDHAQCQSTALNLSVRQTRGQYQRRIAL